MAFGSVYEDMPCDVKFGSNVGETFPTLHHWNPHFRDYIRGISSEDCRTASDFTKKVAFSR